MRTRLRRQITLLDLIVFVAVTAVVLASWRFQSIPSRDYVEYYGELFDTISGLWSRHWSARHAVAAEASIVPFLLWPPHLFLAAWTFALLGLRLVPPRSRCRLLAMKPGTVACAMVSRVLLVEASLAILLQWGLKSRVLFSTTDFKLAVALALSGDGFRIMTPHAGWAVAASWLTLAMNRRWRPESDWIDRAGRVVGFAWIAPIPFYSWVVIHRL